MKLPRKFKGYQYNKEKAEENKNKPKKAKKKVPGEENKPYKPK